METFIVALISAVLGLGGGGFLGYRFGRKVQDTGAAVAKAAKDGLR
jgi:hypothetical protein